ncbi:BCAS3 microtubule associated cell migration factor-like [Bolinopsis microptera]|uniref:BCAS3 microtubule associated cell migration factor-like n=1 Tax=Bolinopsis microptera TaxID=2820187 RepID=UPI0030798A1B
MGGETPEREGATVRPSKVAERSYIESVVDYIHEVVAPQTSPKSEEKELVLWQSTQELKDGSIILFIGYVTGVQCWLVPITGLAYEVFSQRRGPAKTACYLDTEMCHYGEELRGLHPFVLVVDNSNPKPAATCVDIWSIRSGNMIHTIHFKSEIFSLTVNQQVIVVALKEKIAVFDAVTFEINFWISRCYPCSDVQPIGLGSRWLAYSDKGAMQSHLSYGGMCGTGLQSYTATVLNAAESVKKGLSIVGETVGRLTQHNYQYSESTKSRDTDDKAGIVTIVDCIKADGETSLSDSSTSRATMAHFTAHTNSPISALSFDRSGSLLVTADVVGKDFHVFEIKPHPWSSSVCQIHHLYVLHRGDTSASIQNLAFSQDCRWLCASTRNGTTHIFPITPYGGPITCRTHLSSKVVNRHSRFHTSAGINHISHKSNGVPALREQDLVPSYQRHSTIPILPTPNVTTPLVQLKQSPLKSSTNLSQSTLIFPISAVFGKSRLKTPKSSNKSVRSESLFVLGPGGVLVEYKFDCCVLTGVIPADDAPIQLTATPSIQWNLGRSTRSEPVLQFKDIHLLSEQEIEAEDEELCKKDEGWVSYVEIQTYEAPHRCLWMGPQFCFRTVHVLPSSLNNASSSILADQTVVSEDSHHADNIYDDMELHSTPLRTDTIHNSEAINGLCVIESGQGSVEQPSALELNMSVDPCYKKDDLLLETITDAMQDVAIKTRAPDYEDDMAVSQIIDLHMDSR